MSSVKYGRYRVQNHLDPIRVCLGEKNLSSFCYMLDHEEGKPFDQSFIVEGVGGFKNTFAQIQSAMAPKDILDVSLLKGFENFWVNASRIFPLDFLITDQQMQNVYRRTYSTKRALYQFFKYRQTKAVVLTAYYGILGWAASSAARRLGIPLIDMQHGVAGPPHESYEFEHMPATGYNTIPTHFFCWSDKEADSLNSTAKENYKAYDVGQSWALTNVIMSSQTSFRILPARRIETARVDLMEMRQSILLSKSYIKSSSAPDKPNFSILIALQDEKDLVWLKNLISEAPDNWVFYLRLHPGTVGNEIAFTAALEKYKSLGANLRLASVAPLDFLLPHMNVVVTHYSSTVLDGNAFGIPGVCYGEAGHWYFDWMNEDALSFSRQGFIPLFNELSMVEKALSEGPPRSDISQNFDNLLHAVADILPEEKH